MPCFGRLRADPAVQSHGSRKRRGKDLLLNRWTVDDVGFVFFLGRGGEFQVYELQGFQGFLSRIRV